MHLSVLVSPINESIALACDFIDEVIVDHHQTTLALSSLLRAKRFDLSITLFSNTRVALAQLLALIPKRVAPATKIAQIFYTKRIIQRRSEVKMSEFEYNIQLLEKTFTGINTTFPKPLLQFQQTDIQATYSSFKEQLAIDNHKAVVNFHPGFGGSSDANWNVAEYIELARLLEHRKDLEIIFSFGPGDETFLAEFQVLQADLKAKTYISKETVLEFTKLISSFKLFISTSTGTFHLASAVGTKTMTFFADSLFASSKRWKGIGSEELQHNYMIPKDKQSRSELFEQVKRDLITLI